MSQTQAVPDAGSPPGMPRWVKLFGIALIVLVLLVGVVVLSGVHSPLQHGPSNQPSEHEGQQP